MKKKSVNFVQSFIQRILVSLITSLIVLSSAQANIKYTESLYLCDLGIMRSQTLNQLGVDFIHYSQNGQTRSVTASPAFSTALNFALRVNPSFDRWNSANGIDDVSINLESDFYGVQYYLEYCYTWDRILPSDNLNYNVTFLTSLSNDVPFTQSSVDTKCSLKTNLGQVVNTSTLQSPTATNAMTTDFSSMRCTVRFNFKEDNYSVMRPHNGGLVGVDPNITVKVKL